MHYFKNIQLIILISIIACSFIKVPEKNNELKNEKLNYFNSFIDSISKNDTLHINYSTQGCFHDYTEELKIYKKLDNLFAELIVSIPGKQNFLPLTHYLKDSSIIAYSEFENSGRNLKTSNGCTTKEQYIIYSGNDSIKFEDNGCEFKGYSILKNKIFGRTKIDLYYREIYR